MHTGVGESEVQPANYRVIARKGNGRSAHSGVANVAKINMDATKTDVSTSSGFAAAAITCSSLLKPLLVGSIYRPPDNIIRYNTELYTVITTLHQRYREHTVYKDGDANLPNIDWTSDSLFDNSYAIPIRRELIDVLHEVGPNSWWTFN